MTGIASADVHAVSDFYRMAKSLAYERGYLGTAYLIEELVTLKSDPTPSSPFQPQAYQYVGSGFFDHGELTDNLTGSSRLQEFEMRYYHIYLLLALRRYEAEKTNTFDHLFEVVCYFLPICRSPDDFQSLFKRFSTAS
jgi:hypothetical protein